MPANPAAACPSFVRTGSRVARIDGGEPSNGSVTQHIDLVPGWNFISFQVDPGVTDPADVLSGIDGSHVAVYGFNGTDYDYFRPQASGNTLTELLPNVGYWLHMAAQAQLTVAGPISPTTDQIASNTPAPTGLPGLTSQGLDQVVTAYPAIQTIWAYSPSDDTWTSHSRDGPAFLTEFTQTNPGHGYWIVADSALTLATPVSGSLTYYHPDHLGSTNIVTDAAGQLLHESCSYPFGYPRHSQDTESFDPLYGFIDKERDTDTGLHYCEARNLTRTGFITL